MMLMVKVLPVLTKSDCEGRNWQVIGVPLKVPVKAPTGSYAKAGRAGMARTKAKTALMICLLWCLKTSSS